MAGGEGRGDQGGVCAEASGAVQLQAPLRDLLKMFQAVLFEAHRSYMLSLADGVEEEAVADPP